MKSLTATKAALITALLLALFIPAKPGGCVAMFDQEIFFEYEYENYAWGHQHVHWIIDPMGHVRMSRGIDRQIEIKPEHLNDYVNRFDSVVLTIPQKEMNKYVAMIPAAALGKMDGPKGGMYDAGVSVFKCYWLDKTTNKFKTILLSQWGNPGNITNTDSSAVKITEWLKTVNEKFYALQK